MKERDGDVLKLHMFFFGGSLHRNRVTMVYLVKRKVNGQAALDSGEATCVWDSDAFCKTGLNPGRSFRPLRGRQYRNRHGMETL